LPLETVAQTETLNPEETIQNEQTETQSQETSAKTQPGEQIDDTSTQIEANTTSTATVPTGEQETTSVPTQQEEVGQAIARVQAHIEKYANKTAPTSADSEFNKDVKAVTDALDSNTGTPNDGYYFSTKVNSQYDQQEGVQRAVDKLLSGKSPELKATEATHIEDGEIERVTPEVVNESLSTAANNRPDKSKAEMKDWLIDAIDKTVIRLESTADHPPMSEYERKSGYTISGALKDADMKQKHEWDVDAAKLTASKVGYKTFDVPGDGTFKVLNTREHLTRFKKKVLASSGFKETRAKAKTAKPSTKQADAKQLITQYLNEAGKKGVISDGKKFPIKNSVRLEAYGMAVQIANNSDLSDADIKALFEGKQSDIAGNKELLRYEDGYSTEETKTEAPEQEVKSEPVAKESPQQNQDKLKDFGEVLDGAKKHTYSFTKALDEDIDVKEVPLSKSIPLPNYEKMISDGVDPVLVATIAQLRAEIKPRKPKRGASRWVDSVNSARNKIKGLMKGLLQPEDIYKSALGDGYYPIAQLAADILPSQIKDLAKFTLDKSFFSLYEGEENVTKWGVEKSGERNANASFGFGSNSTYFDTKQEALDYIKSNVSDTNTKTGKAQTKFDMWSERGKKGVFLGKKVASRKYIELKRFDTQKEATAYRDSHYDELIELLAKKKKVRAIRRIDNNPRVGTDYRDGKDVTPELFQETFGFRGVQFGNYVEGPRRQQDLNNAYDGLLDLADVLGIPPEALSLNGTLGLAFGARGSGGKNPAAAHYESGGININLTKLNGKGSLAHEFFHGLDNYFGTMDEGDSFLSEGKRDKRKVVQKDGIPTMVETVDADFKVRKEVYDAWKGLYKSIKNETKIIERSESLDKARGKDYWSTVREMTARSFERYVIDKLASKGFESDYLANIVSEEAHDAENKILGDNQAYPYPLNDEMEAVNNAYDNLFKTLKTKKTDKGTALYSKSNKPQAKSTVAQIKALLPRRVQNMVDAGKLKVVQSVDNISDKTYSFSNTEGIEGFYDPDADVLYLISDALDKDNLNSTLNHELYHRARATDKKFQAQLSKLDKQLQDRFKLAAKGVGSKADRDAYKRVMDANTGTADQLEEFQAYLITAYAKNPDSFKGAALKWIKDLYAAIRAVLIRNGIHPKNITPADLNALSKYGAKVKSDGSKLSRENPVALASEQGYKGNDEEEASEWNKAVAAGLDMSFKARMARAKEMGFITNFEDTLAKSSGDKNASTPSNRKIPQRFYHGTAADIEAFEVKHVGRKDKGWIGSGVYVALTPELANTYANVKAPSRSGKIHIDANVMPLHIRADKIYVADEATRAKVRNGSQEYVDNFTAKMQADGYEGAAYFHARGEVEIVIFDPKNVRSIHAAFDPANSDSSDLMASKDTYERFYSQLKREIQRSPDRFFDKSGGQIKAWLKSNAPKLGIKADEIYWSGVNEWLDIQDGKVSKSDMVGFLGENGVQVESVTLDSEGIKKAYYPEDSYMHPVTGDVATMEEWRDSSEDYSDEGGETIDEQLDSLMDVSGEEIDDGREYDEGNVKHNTASLTLPGGKDYQELVLTIPTTEKFNESDETHFGDVGEGKQIAWIRHNTRTDSQGNDTLFLEEVQSQRGQEGRSKGFKENIKKLRQLERRIEKEYGIKITEDTITKDLENAGVSNSLLEERYDFLTNNILAVPPAPFVTDKNNKATNAYITLLLKKAISHAIDNGQTSISWTTGDQQADRYDLSKKIKEIHYVENEDTQFSSKTGKHYFVKILDNNGEEIDIDDNDLTIPEITNLLGKEIADKIESNEGSSEKSTYTDGRMLAGNDLRVGGAWTQAMYGDESGMNSQGKPALMTQAAREITKKLGGTISSVVLDTGTQPALIITPEMRFKVLNEGMPLFSKTPKFSRSSDAAAHVNEWLNGAPLTQSVGGNLGLADESRVGWVTRIFQDGFNRVDTLQKTLKANEGTVNEDNDVYRAEERSSGITAARLDDLRDNNVTPLVDEMKAKDITLEQLDSFVMAKHAGERNDYIAGINPEMQDGGSGLKNADANKILADFETQGLTAKLESLADKVYQINDQTLNTMVRDGLLTVEAYNQYQGQYDNYVPLKGKEGIDDRGGNGQGYSIGGSGIKSAMGRGGGNISESPVAHTIAQAENAIIRAEKNRVGQTLIKLMKDNPDPNFWTVTSTNYNKFIDLEGNLFEGFDELPEGLILNKDVRRVMAITAAETKLAKEEGRKPKSQAAYRLDPSYKYRDDVFSVMAEGKVHQITIEDKILAEQLKKLNSNELNHVLRNMGGVNRYLAMINTAINPEFVITNLERDLQAAGINIAGEHSAKMAKQVVLDVPKAIRGIFKSVFKKEGHETDEWSKLYQELKHEGGTIGFFGLEDIETKVKKIESQLTRDDSYLGKTKDVLNKVQEIILNTNQSVENASRLTAYKAARDAGMSKKKAASLAKNLTVNFNRRGEAAPVINALYLFANASIQGSARLFTALKHPRVRKIVGGMAASSFALAAYNMGAGGEDDDGISRWEKISDYTKQTNMIFMHSDGTYSKFKLPYGYNAFWYAGIAAHDLIYGKKTTAMGQSGKMLSTLVNAFNPIGGADLLDTITPTILKPIEQDYRNINFMMTPIRPENPFDRYDRPESDKAFNNTNADLKAMAKFLNSATGGDDTKAGLVDISPETIKHYVSWVTGGAGMFAGRTIGTARKLATGETIQQKEIPFIRALGGKVGTHFDTETFYSAIKDVEATKAQLKRYQGERDPKASGYFRENRRVIGLAKIITRHKKRIKFLRNRKNDAYRKGDYELAEKMKQAIAKDMRLFTRRYNAAKGLD